LNSATDTPLSIRMAPMAVDIQLLTAFEDVPQTNSERAFKASLDRQARATVPQAHVGASPCT